MVAEAIITCVAAAGCVAAYGTRSSVDPHTRRGTSNYLRVRLEADQVVIECSADGLLVWEQVHALPRSQYPRAPEIVRLGKMNPRGTSDDYPTPGPGGTCAITGLRVFVAKP